MPKAVAVTPEMLDSALTDLNAATKRLTAALAASSLETDNMPRAVEETSKQLVDMVRLIQGIDPKVLNGEVRQKAIEAMKQAKAAIDRAASEVEKATTIKAVAEKLNAVRASIFGATLDIAGAVVENAKRDDPVLEADRRQINKLIADVRAKMAAGVDGVVTNENISRLLTATTELLKSLQKPEITKESLTKYDKALIEHLAELVGTAAPVETMMPGVRISPTGTMAPSVEAAASSYDLSSQDLMDIASAGFDIINMLKEGATLKGSYIYLVDASAVDADRRGSFEKFVTTLAAINARRGGAAQFKVIVVGDTENASGTTANMLGNSMYGTTLSYSKEGDVRQTIASVEVKGEKRITGITTEQRSDAFTSRLAGVCNYFLTADANGFNFGKLLASAAITVAEDNGFVTAVAAERLRQMVREARRTNADGQTAVISLGSAASEETETAIDEALFADLYADTAF